MRRTLDDSLGSIQRQILEMARLVDEALVNNFQAMVDNDYASAQRAKAHDSRIDAIHNSIEAEALKTLALQKPVARELRAVMSSLLISSELERMGDYAEGIAKRMLRDEIPTIEIIPTELHHMLKTVRKMHKRAMKAYLSHNQSKSLKHASKSIRQDARVDDDYARLFYHVIHAMRENHMPVSVGIYLLWVGHSLERVGDRVGNISERIAYIQTGHTNILSQVSNE